jgi:hypothetical protein
MFSSLTDLGKKELFIISTEDMATGMEGKVSDSPWEDKIRFLNDSW